MFMNRLSGFIAMMIFCSSVVFAQLPDQIPAQHHPDVTETELEQFALVFRDIQNIDQQVQEDMLEVVLEEGIDIDRFNEYLISLEDSVVEFHASEDEIVQLNKVVEKIELVQNEALNDIDSLIIENNLTVERYQEIASAIQASPALLEELKKKFAEY